MRIAIAGGGLAGLTAGLLLARAGHPVELFEGDSTEPPSVAADAFRDWERPGVAQYRMPHQVMGRLRRELISRAPEVRDALLEAGAQEHEAFRKIPGGEWLPADEELVFTFVRRPVLESVLRRLAVEAGVRINRGVRVEGLLVEGGAAAGLRTSTGDAAAELVVDATGRRTPVAAWLGDHGLEVPEVERSDCGVVYYCRYYRLLPGSQYPETPYPTGAPLGDASGVRFNLMRADNRTHSILLGTPSWDRGFRRLRESAVFEAVLREMPPLGPYVARGFAEPITEVLAMGDIENLRRHYARGGVSLLPGLVGVGDSYCHTDPLFGWGASFAVAHAAALVDAVAAGGESASISARVEAAIAPEADEAFSTATLEDDARIREWRGEPINPDPESDVASFVRRVVAPGVGADPVLFRAAMRRVMILDSPGHLYRDAEVKQRAIEVAARTAGAPRPWEPPSRERLAAVMAQGGPPH